MAFSPARDVGLGHLGHGDGRLHARLRARLLQEVLQRQRIHDRAQHAHVVGTTAVHAALRELGTAEEVTAPDDDRHLDIFGRLGDLAGDGADDVGVDAQLPCAERLTGEFEKDPASLVVSRHACVRPSVSDLVKVSGWPPWAGTEKESGPYETIRTPSSAC